MGDPKLQNNQPSILKYPGFNGIESCCIVRRFGDTVIATEVADNPGTSISDAIEIVATIIVDQFNIDPEKLQLIEEVPNREPRFSLVSLTRGDTFMHIQRVKFIGASWRLLSQVEVEAMIGQPL